MALLPPQGPLGGTRRDCTDGCCYWYLAVACTVYSNQSRKEPGMIYHMSIHNNCVCYPQEPLGGEHQIYKEFGPMKMDFGDHYRLEGGDTGGHPLNGWGRYGSVDQKQGFTYRHLFFQCEPCWPPGPCVDSPSQSDDPDSSEGPACTCEKNEHTTDGEWDGGWHFILQTFDPNGEGYISGGTLTPEDMIDVAKERMESIPPGCVVCPPLQA